MFYKVWQTILFSHQLLGVVFVSAAPLTETHFKVNAYVGQHPSTDIACLYIHNNEKIHSNALEFATVESYQAAKILESPQQIRFKCEDTRAAHRVTGALSSGPFIMSCSPHSKVSIVSSYMLGVPTSKGYCDFEAAGSRTQVVAGSTQCKEIQALVQIIDSLKIGQVTIEAWTQVEKVLRGESVRSQSLSITELVAGSGTKQPFTSSQTDVDTLRFPRAVKAGSVYRVCATAYSGSSNSVLHVGYSAI